MFGNQRVKRATAVVGTSFVVQTISSVTSFALTLYLVRVFAADDFGRYAATWIAAIAISNIFVALLVTSASTYGSKYNGVRRERYCDRLFFVALCATGAGVLLCSAPLVFIVITGGNLESAHSLALFAILNGICLFGREATVQISFNEGRPLGGLIAVLKQAVSLAVSFLLVDALKLPLTAAGALGISSAALVVSSVSVGGIRRGYAAVSEAKRAVAEVRRNLRSGGWIAVTAVLFFLRTQSHMIVVASLLGAAAAGHLAASRVLFQPIQIAMPALTRAGLPLLSDSKFTSGRSFVRSAIYLTLSVVLLTGLYCGIAVWFSPIVFPIVAGSEFHYDSHVIGLWAAYTVIVSARSSLELFVKVIRLSRRTVIPNVLTTALSVALVFTLIPLLGAKGSLWAIIAAELGTALATYWTIARATVGMRVRQS